MSKRWFDPITGVAKTQDDSPGPGWLAIMAIRMPDGRDMDSTLDGLESWLATAKEGYIAKYSTQLNEIVVDFTGDAAGADRFGDEILPAIQVCRYFSSEREDDIWFISIDGSVPSYEGDEFDLIPDDPDEDVADISGGGGKGGGGPPPIPWDKRVPFPDTGPEPGPPEIPINDQEPDDNSPIEELAKEQADEDLKGIIPDPDGDFEHPDGAPANEKKDRKPCSDCDGTGQKPEDDGAGGDDGDESDSGDGGEGEDDGAGGDDGDGSDGDDGDGDGSGDGDESGDGEGEGEGSSPGECETCGGSGEMPDTAGEDGEGDGDEGDESGDGDDDAEEEEDQPQPDDPYDPAPVVEAANRAIEASNRAVLSDDPAEISEAVDECFRAIGECQQVVDKRSTTQREVLQRALDAGQRALTRLQEVNQ
jgi:hypothetical protein